MRGEMRFSYSTINDLVTCSHSWINRMMGKKKPWAIYFDQGKDGHRIIQDHVAGIKKDPRIDYLTETFPIVEKTAFDPDCKFEMRIRGYSFIGFLDLQDPEKRRFGEIKLSGTPWSLGKFRDAVQRKIYALAHPEYETGVLITGRLDPNEWATTKLKVMEMPLTAKDREEAMEWINAGIDVFEAGDFNGGLDPETGRCADSRCPYGQNCHFRSF